MENIQVALRLRPLNKREASRNEETVWKIPNSATVCLESAALKELVAAKKISSSTKNVFNFDYCFNPTHDNLHLYNSMVKRIALSSLNGINGTIFMYGQTGSGKTYTMMGYNKHEEQKDYDTCVTQPKVKQTQPKASPAKGFDEKGNKQYDYFDYVENYDRGNYIITDISASTGILILSLRDIFQAIEKDLDKTYFLRCSYIEIYNDTIFDLLKPPEKLGETLTVNEDQKKDFYIKGVTEDSVSSIAEILEKLRKGESNRHYARTCMNHSSSRSHTIFRLLVQTVTNNFIREYRREMREKTTNINNDELKNKMSASEVDQANVEEIGGGTLVTESLLNFVDLAGSEKVLNHHEKSEDQTHDESNKVKDRIKEGQYINKSLFFLTQVISLKSEGKANAHIPYRNSPLTKILRSSLGGNSRTLIILCATPALSQFDQTMSTLRFGVNAKKIENKVSANIITSNDNEALKILIADYEKKLKDIENTRAEDQTKHTQLIRQIEELQTHKKQLTERLNQMMRVNLNQLRGSIPGDYLTRFFTQVKRNTVHLDRAGDLILPNCLTKYYSTSITNSDAGRTDGKLDLNRDLRLVFDAEGRFAVQALKVAKKQHPLLLKKVELYKNNFEAIVEEFAGLFELQSETSNKVKYLEQKLKEIVEVHNQQVDEIDVLNTNLDLFCQLKGIADVETYDLEEMEKIFLRNLDIVKNEKARRHYLSKIKTLEANLGVQETGHNESQKENAAEKKKLSFQEIIQGGQLTDDSLVSRNNFEIEELKIKLIGQFNQGIESLDAEMSQAAREVDQAELILRDRERELKKEQFIRIEGRGSFKAPASESSTPRPRLSKSKLRSPKLDIGKSLESMSLDSEAVLSRRASSQTPTVKCFTKTCKDGETSPFSRRSEKSERVNRHKEELNEVSAGKNNAQFSKSGKKLKALKRSVERAKSKSQTTTNPQTKENSMIAKTNNNSIHSDSGIFEKEQHLSFGHQEQKSQGTEQKGGHNQITKLKLTSPMNPSATQDRYFEEFSLCADSFDCQSPRRLDLSPDPGPVVHFENKRPKTEAFGAQKENMAAKPGSFTKKKQTISSTPKRSENSLGLVDKSLLKTYTPIRLEKALQKHCLNKSVDITEKKQGTANEVRKEELQAAENKLNPSKSKTDGTKAKTTVKLVTPEKSSKIAKLGATTLQQLAPQLIVSTTKEIKSGERSMNQSGEADSLNVTHIEPNETFFTNSIFTIKGENNESPTRVANFCEIQESADALDSESGKVSSTNQPPNLDSVTKVRRPRAARSRKTSVCDPNLPLFQ